MGTKQSGPFSDPNELSKFLKEQGTNLVDKRLNPEELARLTGLSARDIRRWGTGQGLPSLEACKKLSKAFGVPERTLRGLREKALEQRQRKKEERREARKRGQEPDLTTAVTELAEFISADEEKPLNPGQTSDSKDNSVLKDANEVAEAYLSIMLQLSESKAKNSRVLLTALSENSMLTTEQKRFWRSLLRAGVRNGATIDYLVCLNRNRARTRAILADIFKCLEYDGELNVYAFNQDGVLPVAEEILIVEGKEALFAIDKGEELSLNRESDFTSFSRKPSHVNAAIHLEREKNDDDNWLRFLYQHYKKRQQLETTKVFSEFNETEQPDLIQLLSDSDKAGDSFIFLRRLPNHARPREHYSPTSDFGKWLNQYLTLQRGYSIDEKELFKELKLRETRFYDGVRSDLTSDCRREIIPQSVLDMLLKEKRAEPYSEKANHKALAERFQEARKLLWEQPNYHLAIVKDELKISELISKIKPSYFEIKTGTRALIEISGTNDELSTDHMKNTWLFTQNLLVIQALQDMLERFWNKIPDRDKDKLLIIQSLDRWIKQLTES